MNKNKEMLSKMYFSYAKENQIKDAKVQELKTATAKFILKNVMDSTINQSRNFRNCDQFIAKMVQLHYAKHHRAKYTTTLKSNKKDFTP